MTDRRKVLRRVVVVLFAAHVVSASLSFVAMDADLDEYFGTIRNLTIDSYEFLGFGEFAVGVGLVTAVLGVLILLLRRTTSRSTVNGPSS
jgi:hypothetical protein